MNEYKEKIKNFNKKQYFIAGVVIVSLVSIVANLVLTRNKALFFLLFTLIYAGMKKEDMIQMLNAAQEVSTLSLESITA